MKHVIAASCLPHSLQRKPTATRTVLTSSTTLGIACAFWLTYSLSLQFLINAVERTTSGACPKAMRKPSSNDTPCCILFTVQSTRFTCQGYESHVNPWWPARSAQVCRTKHIIRVFEIVNHIRIFGIFLGGFTWGTGLGNCFNFARISTTL